jgi:hypothetical protein
VDDDDDGMRTIAGWDAELAELERADTVGDAGGGRDGELEQVVEGSVPGVKSGDGESAE